MKNTKQGLRFLGYTVCLLAGWWLMEGDWLWGAGAVVLGYYLLWRGRVDEL